MNTGTGAANLGAISSAGTITNLIIDAGRITFSGAITANAINVTSLTDIANTNLPVLIQSPDTVFFNALGGNVGSTSSPIFVQTSGQIFAGADGSPASLADFQGSSFDNLVHEIASNPPCTIIFNTIVLQNCTLPPVPPSPGSPGVIVIFSFPFAVPGFDSSFFNLASDYFFWPYFFDERYIYREVAMYYRAPVRRKPAPQKAEQKPSKPKKSFFRFMK